MLHHGKDVVQMPSDMCDIAVEPCCLLGVAPCGLSEVDICTGGRSGALTGIEAMSR